MATRKREEVLRELKAGKVAPLYLLFGAEEYLRSDMESQIREAALADSNLREFNDARFTLASDDVQRALAAAEQLPMMSAHRVVRIAEFNRLREADEEALLRYLARPVESTVVIFIADEMDKRRKLTKSLMDACVTLEFAPLHDAELMQWARTRLREIGANTDERTLGHLIALVGANVRRLAVEMEKLMTAAAPSGVITGEMVDDLIARSRELSNFELTDQLIVGNQRRALQTLQKLLDDGAEPLMLLGLVASHYHRLTLAKELMKSGAPKEEVYRLIPMPFGKRDDFLAVARRAERRELTDAINRIAAADIAIKTSQGKPRTQLEMLVCELVK